MLGKHIHSSATSLQDNQACGCMQTASWPVLSVRQLLQAAAHLAQDEVVGAKGMVLLRRRCHRLQRTRTALLRSTALAPSFAQSYRRNRRCDA
jgi:hypothetical protein